MDVKAIADAVQNKLLANGFEETDIHISGCPGSIWMRIDCMDAIGNDSEKTCRVYISPSDIAVAGVTLDGNDNDWFAEFQDEESFMQYLNKIIDAATAYHGR